MKKRVCILVLLLFLCVSFLCSCGDDRPTIGKKNSQDNTESIEITDTKPTEKTESTEIEEKSNDSQVVIELPLDIMEDQ